MEAAAETTGDGGGVLVSSELIHVVTGIAPGLIATLPRRVGVFGPTDKVGTEVVVIVEVVFGLTELVSLVVIVAVVVVMA